MKASLLSLLLCFSLCSFLSSDFITEQKKFDRVKNAATEKEASLKTSLAKKGISFDKLNLLIIAYKNEQDLDLYVKNNSDKTYQFFKSYAICAKSGELGPKRKMGDYQVPEGFYHIDRFNPASSYYLSLGVSYPNEADRKKSNAANLGGDIFIHGECVTIGCMPMTNDKIKEIYIAAIQAKQNGQSKIPVYLFPYKMEKEQHQTFLEKYSKKPDLISFWNNLKKGYDKFMQDKTELSYTINKAGDYVFNL